MRGSSRHNGKRDVERRRRRNYPRSGLLHQIARRAWQRHDKHRRSANSQGSATGEGGQEPWQRLAPVNWALFPCGPKRLAHQTGIRVACTPLGDGGCAPAEMAVFQDEKERRVGQRLGSGLYKQLLHCSGHWHKGFQPWDLGELNSFSNVCTRPTSAAPSYVALYGGFPSKTMWIVAVLPLS